MFESPAAKKVLRNRLGLTTALCGCMAAAVPAHGQAVTTPVGSFTVADGSPAPTVGTAGTVTTIGASANTILEWGTPGGSGGLAITGTSGAHFANSGTSGRIAMLNRVMTGTQTTIDGSLTSDPSVGVYIVNPNGIVFGDGARVNVGSLVASTLDVPYSEFLTGGSSLRFQGSATSTAGVHVDGTRAVLAAGGDNAAGLGKIVLVGASVSNNGSLRAPGGEVAMAAATDVTM